MSHQMRQKKRLCGSCLTKCEHPCIKWQCCSIKLVYVKREIPGSVVKLQICCTLDIRSSYKGLIWRKMQELFLHDSDSPKCCFSLYVCLALNPNLTLSASLLSDNDRYKMMRHRCTVQWAGPSLPVHLSPFTVSVGESVNIWCDAFSHLRTMIQMLSF